jgi:SAM-dependent methyltransferase
VKKGVSHAASQADEPPERGSVVSEKNHYSYRLYADPSTARHFYERRFGGPIGSLIADEQARVLAEFAGEVRDRFVLDVGTGTGRAAMLLARDGAQVTAVDASEEMLAVAREQAAAERLSIRFVPGDAHHLDFSDRSFDLVVSLRVLMHTPDWQQCVGELCRVARRRLILDYPSVTSFALLESIGRRIAHVAGMKTEPYRVLGSRAVRRELRLRGFDVRSVHRQFVLPIALHKTVGSQAFSRSSRQLSSRLGLLRLFGSPITLVADRCES